ncbi:MAG: hypothetical protein IPG76_06060 [Acidobacteria bacterium]|jgi:membrane protein implicated in regulation of membrane protease activity|nr:hypothetical protein [Acidobacteriota bacterium]
MNIIRIFVMGIAFLIAALIALALAGMAFTLLRFLFWVIVGLIVIAGLWKLFGPKDGAGSSDNNPQGKLENAELTIDEYKRKLEEQLKQK